VLSESSIYHRLSGLKSAPSNKYYKLNNVNANRIVPEGLPTLSNWFILAIQWTFDYAGYALLVMDH